MSFKYLPNIIHLSKLHIVIRTSTIEYLTFYFNKHSHFYYSMIPLHLQMDLGN